LPKDLERALFSLDREAHLPFLVAAMTDRYRPCE
jgi:hypothetical protein